ncbi:hypothetical protein FQA39_LY00853 [Lamprigera yunnana]|nr:hypothetical protein FQA39_LY00853 [Lamprigera yunnana]
MSDIHKLSVKKSSQRHLTKNSNTTIKSGVIDTSETPTTRSYENKIFDYLSKITNYWCKDSAPDQKRNNSKARSNNTSSRHNQDRMRKRRKRAHRHRHYAINRSIPKSLQPKPLRRAVDIINATLDYGLSFGILSKKGKYFCFSKRCNDFDLESIHIRKLHFKPPKRKNDKSVDKNSRYTKVSVKHTGLKPDQLNVIVKTATRGEKREKNNFYMCIVISSRKVIEMSTTPNLSL